MPHTTIISNPPTPGELRSAVNTARVTTTIQHQYKEAQAIKAENSDLRCMLDITKRTNSRNVERLTEGYAERTKHPTHREIRDAMILGVLIGAYGMILIVSLWCRADFSDAWFLDGFFKGLALSPALLLVSAGVQWVWRFVGFYRTWEGRR